MVCHLRRVVARGSLFLFLGASTLFAPLRELLTVLASGGFAALLAYTSGAHHFGEGMPRAIRLLRHPIFLTQDGRC